MSDQDRIVREDVGVLVEALTSGARISIYHRVHQQGGPVEIELYTYSRGLSRGQARAVVRELLARQNWHVVEIVSDERSWKALLS